MSGRKWILRYILRNKERLTSDQGILWGEHNGAIVAVCGGRDIGSGVAESQRPIMVTFVVGRDLGRLEKRKYAAYGQQGYNNHCCKCSSRSDV